MVDGYRTALVQNKVERYHFRKRIHILFVFEKIFSLIWSSLLTLNKQNDGPFKIIRFRWIFDAWKRMKITDGEQLERTIVIDVSLRIGFIKI